MSETITAVLTSAPTREEVKSFLSAISESEVKEFAFPEPLLSGRYRLSFSDLKEKAIIRSLNLDFDSFSVDAFEDQECFSDIMAAVGGAKLVTISCDGYGGAGSIMLLLALKFKGWVRDERQSESWVNDQDYRPEDVHTAVAVFLKGRGGKKASRTDKDFLLGPPGKAR